MNTPDERWDFDGATLGVWRDGPCFAGRKTATIGAFACDDAGSGAHGLREAATRLRAEGFEAMLGPMDGNTWSSYRLVIESDGRPPFLMEPHNPAYYCEAFDQAGFEVVARYCSAERKVELPASQTPPPPGIRLRNIRSEAFEAELGLLFELSLQAFARNAFFSPIGVDEFLASYLPVQRYIDPQLVLFAEDTAGALQGFLFAIPNYAEGSQPATVIVKTYASRLRGCGSMLVNAFHERARAGGFSRIVHALMHTDNLSAAHSEKTGGKIFRRYALWGRVF